MLGGVAVMYLNNEFKGHSPRALVVEPCDRNSGPVSIMTGHRCTILEADGG